MSIRDRKLELLNRFGSADSLQPKKAASDSLPPGHISIEQIEIGENPRKNFDQRGLASLARSIESVGLLQPIVVRKRSHGFELIEGERRLRAVVSLGWTSIEATIKDADDIPEARLPIARVVANLQREPNSDAEIARALHRHKRATSETNQEIAKSLGETEKWVQLKIKHAEILDELACLEDPTSDFWTLATSVVVEVSARPADQRKSLLKQAIRGATVKEIRNAAKKSPSRSAPAKGHESVHARLLDRLEESSMSLPGRQKVALIRRLRRLADKLEESNGK